VRTPVAVVALLLLATFVAAALLLPRERSSGEEASPIVPTSRAEVEGPGDLPSTSLASGVARARVGVSEERADPVASADAHSDPMYPALGKLLVHVVDPWGRPVDARLSVRAVPLDDGSRLLSDTFEGRADAVDLRLPIGTPHRVDVELRNSQLYGPGSYEPAYSGGGPIAIELPLRGGRISGRVVAAESGSPPEDPSLSRSASGDHGGSAGVTSLGDDGGFDFLTTAGEVELTGVATGRSRRTILLSLGPGEWIADVEIPLARVASVPLRGRVVDDTGVSVHGAIARVSIFRSQGTEGAGRIRLFHSALERSTDAEGGFHLDLSPEEDATLDVRAPGYEPTAPVAIDLSAAACEVEIELARAGAIRVRGALQDGSPWTPAHIALVREGATILEATLRRDRMAAAKGARFAGRAHVLRRLRSSRAFGAVREERKGEGIAPDPAPDLDEFGFATIEGIVPGELRVFLRDGTLEGKAAAFVVAGETATIEVPLRRIEGR